MQQDSVVSLTIHSVARAASTVPASGRLAILARSLLSPLRSFRIQAALVFGGLTMLLCGAATLVLSQMLTSEIRRDTGRSLNAVAQTAARTLAGGLDERLRLTRVLAESGPLWADGLGSPAVRDALARVQATRPSNAWIGVADARGEVRAATAGMLLGQSVAQRPWFTRGLKDSYVGDVHRALLLEKLIPREPGAEPIRFVDFSAPIRIDGKVVGVLGMHGTWDWSRAVVTSLLPADAARRSLSVFIFDRSGKVLYSPVDGPSDGSTLSLDALLPVQESLAGRNIDTHTDSDTDSGGSARVLLWPDGRTYLTTLVALPTQSAVTDLGWQIVAREPVAIALERAQVAARQAWAIVAVLAILASAAAWWASGLLGRPLSLLSKAARDVQNRVPGAAIPILDMNLEVQSLSSTLASMTARLDATYRTAPVGMCQTDPAGVVLSANDRLGAIVAMPSGALPQQRLLDWVCARDRAALAIDLKQLGDGLIETVSRELTLTRAEGEELRVMLSASMVPPTEGAGASFVVVVEDISERVMAQAAERSNAAKTSFLSQVSHELRTPLNAVLGFSQLMQLDDDALPQRQRARVDSIAEAGKHLLAMIEDLLDLTQIDSNRMTMSLEPVRVEEAVEQSTALVIESARAANITISVKPPMPPLRGFVRADHVRLRQVLVNLLTNAVKYNRPGGKVSVQWAAMPDGKSIELVVADTGHGIRADRLGELFQPFNRLGAESSGIKGTGIGLVITRKLVEMMDGRLRVTSVPDVGSRFTVELPVTNVHSVDIGALEQASGFSVPAPAQRNRRTLMYVEDNEVNILVLTGALGLRPDFQLVVARSGEEALRLAAASPPDLFLLDMHLGDMTGFELAVRLRLLPRTASLPIIALSAEAAPSAIEAAAAAGFAAYLTKPLDLRKLFSSVDAATLQGVPT